jgi:hypothetical protein
MKRLIMAVMICLLSLAAPDSLFAQEWGDGVTLFDETEIEEIFIDPNAYDGQRIKIKGWIEDQDEQGRWFYLADEFARIYVDLYEHVLHIPPLTGRMVYVEGDIKVEFGIPSMYAIGIEIIKQGQ